MESLHWECLPSPSNMISTSCASVQKPFALAVVPSRRTLSLHSKTIRFKKHAVLKAAKDNDYFFEEGSDSYQDFESEQGFDYDALENEEDYEKERELADMVLEDYGDPEKLRKRIEDRIKAKQHIMLQPQTGSTESMVVTFRSFDYTDSYIWMEFNQCPTNKEIDLVLTTIRSWYIIGQLGSFNSQNLQLTKLPVEVRPHYDSVQAAEKLRPAFHNIGDLELQGNVARLWVDIGASDPLILDVLINCLQNLNSESIGIKNLVFGGKQWGSWRESLVSRKDGYQVFVI